LSREQLTIAPEALKQIIGRYTREAGVRELERQVGRIARKVARRIAEGQASAATITPDDLFDLLGQERNRPEKSRRELPAGVATGLAWTETGGDVLYIEAALRPGMPGLRLTGQLGKVMKESARAALSLIVSRAKTLGIDPRRLRREGIHIHVPAGAVPKDGPSAGVAIVSALASLLTGVPLARSVAMTGEITLSGLVLPVGGIKEKVLAARRAGVRTVVLPRDNEPDTRELPAHVREEMNLVFAERIEEALAVTLPDLQIVSRR
jgi:ATP-dependent Lon protease